MIKIERGSDAFRILEEMFADPNTTAVTIAHRLTADKSVAQVVLKADGHPQQYGMWTPPLDAIYTKHEVWDR